MDNDMAGRQLSECVITLLDKAKSRNKLFLIIEHICKDRPDLAELINLRESYSQPVRGRSKAIRRSITPAQVDNWSHSETRAPCLR